jgi:antitoxin ParD1/3/4
MASNLSNVEIAARRDRLPPGRPKSATGLQTKNGDRELRAFDPSHLDHIRGGSYWPFASLIRAALRVLERDEEEQARKLAALDAALARGIADAEASRVTRLDDAFTRIRKELGFPDEDSDR